MEPQCYHDTPLSLFLMAVTGCELSAEETRGCRDTTLSGMWHVACGIPRVKSLASVWSWAGWVGRELPNRGEI